MNLNYQLLKNEIDKLDKKLANQAGADSDGKKFSLLILEYISVFICLISIIISCITLMFHFYLL